MNKPLRTLIILVTVVLAVPLLWMWSHRSRNQGALAKYKDELRAKGEKLTWTELGYPRPAETNNSLQKMQTAVDKIGPCRTDPGKLGLMSYVGPGRAQPFWAAAQPQMAIYYKGSNAPSWVEFERDNESAQGALVEIRAAQLRQLAEVSTCAAAPSGPMADGRCDRGLAFQGIGSDPV
jgi:hypothetical protein